MSSPSTPHVVIVGGGLAGLAAASALAKYKVRVTLCESRPRLGGRASSFVDHETGETIDNCQHVGMGCCTNLLHFCRETGIDSCFRVDRELTFIGPRGTFSTFSASALPAPLHLSLAFARLPYLSFTEKRLLSAAIRKLSRTPASGLRGLSFASWLKSRKQTPNLVRDVWEVLLVSALSESLDRIDAAYARKVIVDGFLANRHGWEVYVPTKPWDLLYSDYVLPGLASKGAEIRLQAAIREFIPDSTGRRVKLVRLNGGEEISCDEAILAVSHFRTGDLLPEGPEFEKVKASIAKLESAPISSVHLWYDRPITTLPHAVIVGRLSQWLFAKEHGSLQESVAEVGRFGYQVVISASRALKEQKSADVIQTVSGELADLFPEAARATLLHSRMVTEHRAVFSPLPGVDEHRPDQQSPWENLQIAGDWTQTGWPSTMESAVRSGYLAAQNILRRAGVSAQLLQADLPVTWLARLSGIRTDAG